MKKHLSFNRTFFAVALAGYVAIVLLLAVLDIYLISNFNRNYIAAQADSVSACTGHASEALQNLKRFVYEKWLYDADFLTLGSYREKENLMNARFELMKNLENNLSVHNDASAFVLFYSGEEGLVYKYDKAQIPDASMASLKSALSEWNDAHPVSSPEWFMLDADKNPCAVIGYTHGNATIYGVYSLKSRLRLLEDALPKGTAFLIRDGERGLFAPEGVENPEALLQETEQVISERASLFGSVDTAEIRGSLFMKSAIEGTEIVLYTKIPYRFEKIYRTQLLVILLVTALANSALFVLIIFIRKQFVRPLRELNQEMVRIQNGLAYEPAKKEYFLKEFDDTHKTLGYMTEALEKQKIATYEETVEKQRARIQYLQLQLKPHFYLNGLKTVNAMAVSGDTDGMQKYLQHLSQHLRYLLQLERDEVDILQELEFSENYINLRREMSGRQIRYHVYNELPEGGFPVPVLCIQTFLENSVKYAKLGSIDGVLELSVEIIHFTADEEEYLDITVRDNGQGYSENILEALNSEEASPEALQGAAPGDEPKGTNVGVNNLRQRCRILYGELAQLSFRNEDGAVNEIVIPRRKEERP